MREVDYIKLQDIHQGSVEHSTRQYWKDVEGRGRDAYLYNENVATFGWNNVSVSLLDKASQQEKYLLQRVSGRVQSGRLNRVSIL